MRIANAAHGYSIAGDRRAARVVAIPNDPVRGHRDATTSGSLTDSRSFWLTKTHCIYLCILIAFTSPPFPATLREMAFELLTGTAGRTPRAWPDIAGSAVGFACAVHCLAPALVPGLLAVPGVGVLLTEQTEWWLIGTALIIACACAWLGFRRHKNLVVVARFFASATAMVVSRCMESIGPHRLGTLLAVVGAVGLLTAHILNLRLSHPSSVREKSRTPLPLLGKVLRRSPAGRPMCPKSADRCSRPGHTDSGKRFFPNAASR